MASRDIDCISYLYHLVTECHPVIKSRRMRCLLHVARIGDRKGAYKVLVGKPDWKRSLVRRRRKWEDNIRMDVTEIDWEAVNRIDLARDGDKWRAVVNAVLMLRVP